MRFLHTSDWHVGKTLRGRSRLAEQSAVLAEIVDIASREQVDAVLIAGDLYDSSVPTPDAQRLVVRTLLDLAATGARVVAIAGNHDNAKTFDAYSPLMDAAGISMLGTFRRPDNGGVLAFTTRSTGESVRIALLPFLSQRYAVTAADLIGATPDANAAQYDARVRSLIAALTGSAAGFADDAVNIVMTHLTVVAGRSAAANDPRSRSSNIGSTRRRFPIDTHYAALGHLHRRQTHSGRLPRRLQRVTAGHRLRRAGQHPGGLPGRGVADDAGARHRHPDHRGPPAANPARYRRRAARAGRGVSRRLPAGLGHRADPGRPARGDHRRAAPGARGAYRSGVRRHAGTGVVVGATSQTPEELFAEFYRQQGGEDPRLLALFSELHDELTTADADGSS